VRSVLASSYHVCKQYSEATKQQDASRNQWNVWNQLCGNAGKYDDGHDLQGERAIVERRQ